MNPGGTTGPLVLAFADGGIFVCRQGVFARPEGWTMLDFLTPQLFDALVWVVIAIGGVWAIRRLVRDLTGPPRWPDDNASGERPPES
ncbi:MAG: hypothetical protein Kow0077_12060 [Anaerolineae bacterium]